MAINTLEDLLKLGDMPIEEKTKLLDSIIFSAEHKSEFLSEVNKIKLDENKTSITFTRQYLPEVDKDDPRYKNGLTEGVTPKAEDISEAEFTVGVKENGWYHFFTNKMLRHSYHEFLERSRKHLQNLFTSYEDENIADAYFTSANVSNDVNLLDLDGLLGLQSRLYKNGAEPFEDGNYKLVVSVEVAQKMVVAFKDLLTHTSENNSVIKGYVGQLAGFTIIRSNLQAFKTTNGKAKFLAYGKTYDDKYPVNIVEYGNGNAQIIFKNLGEGGNDPLNQRGTIGLYVDGQGFFVYDDSAVIRGEVTVADLTYITKFDNANRSNLVRTETAPSNLLPDVSTLTLKVGETHTLVIKDGSDADVTANCTFTSINTKVATVDSETTKGKITAVKSGLTKVLVEKDSLATVINVIVVNA